jgi:hypothetical protein
MGRLVTVGGEEVSGVAKDILGREIVTAAQLDAMTPAERHERFEASIVTDPNTLPPEYLARVRAHLEATIARRDAEHAARRGIQNAS